MMTLPSGTISITLRGVSREGSVVVSGVSSQQVGRDGKQRVRVEPDPVAVVGLGCVLARVRIVFDHISEKKGNVFFLGGRIGIKNPLPAPRIILET